MPASKRAPGKVLLHQPGKAPARGWAPVVKEGIMDFELSEEQQQLQNAAIEFARLELNDDVIRRDRDEVFSHQGWKACARFGVQGFRCRPNTAAWASASPKQSP